MRIFTLLLDLAATLGFIYFMTRPVPDDPLGALAIQRNAIWCLAVRSGCQSDFRRRIEKHVRLAP